MLWSQKRLLKALAMSTHNICFQGEIKNIFLISPLIWSCYQYICLSSICQQNIMVIDGCIITKTYLYNFDPLKPHFYIVKLEFTGDTLFFLFLLKKYIVGTC